MNKFRIRIFTRPAKYKDLKEPLHWYLTNNRLSMATTYVKHKSYNIKIRTI